MNNVSLNSAPTHLSKLNPIRPLRSLVKMFIHSLMMTKSNHTNGLKKLSIPQLTLLVDGGNGKNPKSMMIILAIYSSDSLTLVSNILKMPKNQEIVL